MSRTGPYREQAEIPPDPPAPPKPKTPINWKKWRRLGFNGGIGTLGLGLCCALALYGRRSVKEHDEERDVYAHWWATAPCTAFGNYTMEQIPARCVGWQLLTEKNPNGAPKYDVTPCTTAVPLPNGAFVVIPSSRPFVPEPKR